MGRLTTKECSALDPAVHERMSKEGVPLRRPDIVGGLEIRQFPTYSAGLYRITWNGEQAFPPDFSQERKRNAVALRALILEIWPDWTVIKLYAHGQIPRTEDQSRRWTRLRQLVMGVTARTARGQCVLCGFRPHDGRPCREWAEGDPTRLTEAEVAWSL